MHRYPARRNVRNTGSDFAYKVVDGKAVSTPIEVFEINDGKEYIVESGLSEGDVIVSEGAGLLKDGTVVSASATPQANETNMEG